MSRKQNQGESVTQFLAELRLAMKVSKFSTDLKIRLRDQFVFDLRNKVAQKQLFAKPDEISLEEVVSHSTETFRAELITCS